MSSPVLDFFNALSLPRRVALDSEVLHQAYANFSKTAHPDHGGTEEQAALINAAYETLRTPEKRLKHLLDLAGPEEAKAWRTVPMDEAMMALFLALGQAMEASSKFLESQAKAQTALAKALLADEKFRQREVLESIGMDIEARRTVLEDQLISIDEQLSADAPGDLPWQQVAAAQARFAYLGKWQGQIRERLLQLM